MPDTTQRKVWQSLPTTIRRRCCPGKGCGYVELTKHAEVLVDQQTLETIKVYTYRRSNGDIYQDRRFSDPETMAVWVATSEPTPEDIQK